MLGEGDRGFPAAVVGGVKNGDVAERLLNPGDSIGGLFDIYEPLSGRIQGPDDRFSTADSTGEVAPEDAFFGASSLPSA